MEREKKDLPKVKRNDAHTKSRRRRRKYVREIKKRQYCFASKREKSKYRTESANKTRY